MKQTIFAILTIGVFLFSFCGAGGDPVDRLQNLVQGMNKVLKDNADDPKAAGEKFTQYIKNNKGEFVSTIKALKEKYPNEEAVPEAEKERVGKIFESMLGEGEDDKGMAKLMMNPEFTSAAQEGQQVFMEIMQEMEALE
jgi:hypothetical protein